MIGNRRLILIVEDNAVTRRALQALFKSRGWAVSVAETVAEGLAQLDPPPDVIVLDLMLPDGDGEEVLREVRSRRGSPQTREIRRNSHGLQFILITLPRRAVSLDEIRIWFLIPGPTEGLKEQIPGLGLTR